MLNLPPVDEPPQYNSNYVFFWNHAALELNRLTHSITGPQAGPTISSRVLGILHLAMHDAYFAIQRGYDTYLDQNPAADPLYRLPAIGGATDTRMAVAGAAITVLDASYGKANIGPAIARDTADQLDQLLRQHIGRFSDLDALSSSYQFGVDVGFAMLNLLAIKAGEPGADPGAYRPKNGRYFFRDEPTNPVRLVPIDPNNPDGPKRAARMYHAPFYGMTAKRFAVQMTIDGVDTEHAIADPPVGFGTTDFGEYNDAVRDVIAMGGAPELNGTKRRPDQTVGGYFWAYDGANLIGSPPRLYNQILRKIAWGKAPANEPDRTTEFVRLFALANVAMADAGIFAWREKYCFEFWRPLPGVREHDISSGPPHSSVSPTEKLADLADPFWLTLGAPETNTDRVSFKPPFPAYPSGHATFGAAIFQMMRLYYHRNDTAFAKDGPDSISFDFVSEELNGVSRDLRQPYDPSQPITEQPGDVRTRVLRKFSSLWAAIFENAISRIWLGVHWRFDAFAAKDVLIPVQDPGSSSSGSSSSTSSDPGPSGPEPGGSPYKIEADGTTAYKEVGDIRYVATGKRGNRDGFPIGGVPLGIGIANDIWGGKLKPTPPGKQPIGRDKCGVNDLVGSDQAKSARPPSMTPKSTPTNIR